MLEGFSTFNEVLLVHGRLRMGKINILGAISSVGVFAGLALGMIVGWIWNSLVWCPHFGRSRNTRWEPGPEHPACRANNLDRASGG